MQARNTRQVRRRVRTPVAAEGDDAQLAVHATSLRRPVRFGQSRVDLGLDLLVGETR